MNNPQVWISIEKYGLPNFNVFGFHVHPDIEFKTADGEERIGLYQGYGGFSVKGASLEDMFDASFDNEKRVTHWRPSAEFIQARGIDSRIEP